jgi:integrase
METKRHSVNLKQYRKVNGKWQFVPVARDAKGAPDPRLVLIDGEPTSSKGGTFYLEFKHHGKRRQESIGTVPREALEAWRTKCAVLTGLIEPEDEPEVVERGLTIEQAIEKYLVEVEATKGKKTYRQYLRELEWFRKHCKKRHVSQLNRSDAMALFAQGRREVLDDKPLNQKTINRRVIIMLQAMRSQGAVITMNKGDWPKTIDKKVEIYQPEELKPFFAVCNPEERLIFQVFLCSGFREREVATLAWTDIQWKDGKLAVSAKPELGFTPKSYEERSVPIPMALIAALRAKASS